MKKYKLWFPKSTSVHAVLLVRSTQGDSVMVSSVGRLDGGERAIGGERWMKTKSLTANYEERTLGDFADTSITDEITAMQMFYPAPGCGLPEALCLLPPSKPKKKGEKLPCLQKELLAEAKRMNALLERILVAWEGPKSDGGGRDEDDNRADNGRP